MRDRRLRLIPARSMVLAACATSPLGRSLLKRYSDDDMARMGATAFTETAQKTPVSQDGRATARPASARPAGTGPADQSATGAKWQAA